MIPRLTDDLKQAIEDHGGAPLSLVDDANNSYVLLRADQFEKIRVLSEVDEFEPCASYPLIDEVMKEDWDDPSMDVYNDYDSHRTQQ